MHIALNFLEIIERKLNYEDKFIVIGSDGLWEFITSQEVY